MRETLFLIDGLNQIFRAYYAPFRPLSSPSGEPTKMAYVFMNMLIQLIRDMRPNYLAVVMEGGDRRLDFRRSIDPHYKANRDAPPEDFGPQVDRIKELLHELGIPVLHVPGFEADDLMATIASKTATEDGLEVFMVSSDKDLRQLLEGDRVSLFDPRKGIVLDAPGLEDEFGYTPAQAIDIQTLAGDSTDNIPGVRGIGQKTAVKLVRKYGSADAVVSHAAELTPKQRENVLAFSVQMPITRRLVTLRDDVPLDFNLDRCVLDLDLEAAAPMLDELGFQSIAKKLHAVVA